MLNSHRLRTAARIATGLCVCILFVLSLLPASQMVRTHAPKVVEHFFAYGGTGLFAAFGFARAGWPAVRLTTALIALAGALEYAQRFSPGRDSALDTFIASAIGATAGVGCLVLAVRLIGGRSARPALGR